MPDSQKYPAPALPGQTGMFLTATGDSYANHPRPGRDRHLSQETLLAAVDASANATGIDWGPAQVAKTGENLALAVV
jgi:hypothetical protein